MWSEGAAAGGCKVSRGYEMSDIVITPQTMSNRSWDGVRLRRRRGWTCTHTLPFSSPCKHNAFLFRHYPCLELLSVFFQHVKPRLNPTPVRFPVVRWYAVKQQQWFVEKNSISLFKHNCCLVWKNERANPSSRSAVKYCWAKTDSWLLHCFKVFPLLAAEAGGPKAPVLPQTIISLW